jgi:TrkA domain protein
MALVEETRLPGVGVRYEFTTEAGDRVGVIVHRSGGREVLVYAREDPDSCRSLLRLGDDDAHTLVDLLGGSEVSERLDEVLSTSIEGLMLEWIPLRPGSAHVGEARSELGLRTRTGASIVAVLRGAETVASPRADFRLEPGDTAVLVGSPEAIREALAVLTSA